MDKRQCVSCHQVPFIVWTLNQASLRQFEVDDERAKPLSGLLVYRFDGPLFFANGEYFLWSLGYSIHMVGSDRTHPGVGG